MTYWLWSVSRDAFPAFVRAGTFALRRQGRARLAEVRPGDRIVAYVAGRRVLAGLFEATGTAFDDATVLAPGVHAPHRVRVRPLVVLPDEARVPYDGFAPHLRVVDLYAGLPTPEARFRAVVQRVLHPLPAIDGKVLEFVIRARAGADPEALMAAVEAVRDAARRETPPAPPPVVAEPPVRYDGAMAFDRAVATERVLAHVEARGLRLRPVRGRGVPDGAAHQAVRPPRRTDGRRQEPAARSRRRGDGRRAAPGPGPAGLDGPGRDVGLHGPRGPLPAGRAPARRARGGRGRRALPHARAGRDEPRSPRALPRRGPEPDGGPRARPRAAGRARRCSPSTSPTRRWQAVRLPPNLALVGTVNVDESAHAFSAKVLDRAFVLALAATRPGGMGADGPDAGPCTRARGRPRRGRPARSASPTWPT